VGTTVAAGALTTNGGAIGDCITDQFSLSSPGNVGSPVICGVNAGQHMIVDASDACSVASFNIGGTTTPREWDIKVTQYACGDLQGGPEGCLQYFTGTSGKVSSFNFPTTTPIGSTTTHLSSQRYSMCFRQEQGFCSICFTTSTTITPALTTPAIQSSFGLSVSPLAALAEAGVDQSCTSDYLLIQSATSSPAVTTNTRDRLCGRIFDTTPNSAITGHSVCTSVIPFQIGFVSNANEATGRLPLPVVNDPTTNEQDLAPGGIVGFSLNYVEQPCPTAPAG
jgi:hypothetical protein